MTARCSATSSSSAVSHGAQASRSATDGLFAGGAHRTDATMRTASSRCPSPAAMLSGLAASPHRYSDANNTSPLRSPVKMRPVRLPPCAAGARPTISTRGCSAPQPGTGRPQYGSARKDRRLSAATCSRQATSLAHARQTDCLAASSASVPADAARVRTAPASAATGVADVAGSSGQPLPGNTGPVTAPSRCPPATRRCRPECRARWPPPR